MEPLKRPQLQTKRQLSWESTMGAVPYTYEISVGLLSPKCHFLRCVKYLHSHLANKQGQTPGVCKRLPKSHLCKMHLYFNHKG